MSEPQDDIPAFEPPTPSAAGAPGRPAGYPEPPGGWPYGAPQGPYGHQPGGPSTQPIGYAGGTPPPTEHPYGMPPGAPPPYGMPPGAPPPYGMPPGAPPPYGVPSMPYGYGPPPAGYALGITSNDDTTWAMLAYLGQFLGGFIVPLVVYLARKNQSPYVRFHGAQALNFALTYIIIAFGGVTLSVGLMLFVVVKGSPATVILPALAIAFVVVFLVAHVVYLVVGAVRANRPELYRLPTWLCWRMIK